MNEAEKEAALLAVRSNAGLGVRPCEKTLIFACGKKLEPDGINRLSSSGETFATWLCANRDAGFELTRDEIMLVAEAIQDNWRRYWASC